MKCNTQARLIIFLLVFSMLFTGCSITCRMLRRARGVEEEPVREVVEEPVEEPIEEPVEEVEVIEPPVDPVVEPPKEVVEKPEEKIDIVRPTHPGVEAVLEVVYFAFDSSEILPPAKEKLQRNAQWLLENPDVNIIIEGHCDERGTEQYNIGLGERRATAVKEHLVRLGVDQDRLEIISYGESRPVDPRPTEEAWAKNRRVEFKRIP